MTTIPATIENRLTQHAKNVLRNARTQALKGKHPVNAEHILNAIAQEKGSLGATALFACDISVAKPNPANGLETNDLKKVIKTSMRVAMQHHQNFIGTEHLLYGLLDKNIDLTATIPLPKRRKLKEYLKKYFHLNEQLNTSIESFKKQTSENNIVAQVLIAKKGNQTESPTKTHRKKHQRASILRQFCENLTESAQNQTLDPLVGRSAELDRMIRILIRRTKNNPLLIGEPGVGKTALVQGLAQRIYRKEVPDILLDKQVYVLNLNSLVAGTTFRGEFEERMYYLTQEASGDDVLLFIDEIHTIVGAGSAQGSLDVANILKPALVNGEFQCIGATTFEEFKKSIEKDTALDRRFQKIPVYEESREQSIKTLQNLAPLYQKHHSVYIPKEIIDLCVDLSTQYIPHRALPDKALDVLDEASSKVHLQNSAAQHNQKTYRLKQQLNKIIELKDKAKDKDDYEKAQHLHIQQGQLEKELQQEKTKNTEQQLSLTEQSIYEVIAEMTSTPLESIQNNSNTNLASALKQSVVGQDAAIDKIAYAIQRNRTGVRDTTRPIGSFLFSGASGVGKSYLAKVLAQHYTNTKTAFIQLDMSEFSESHSVSRLIGAPAGYVGYEDAGFLTKKIRQNSNAVVLFDEIEKAHSNVLNILLQILEDGVLTDSHGQIASFRNTIIILTTNIGADSNASGIGFSSQYSKEQHIRNELARSVRKELINRIDDIVLFNELTQRNMQQIADKELQLIQNRISPLVNFSYKKTVPAAIAQKALTQDKGARAIRSVIQEHIEDAIASELTKQETSDIVASTKGRKICFEFISKL